MPKTTPTLPLRVKITGLNKSGTILQFMTVHNNIVAVFVTDEGQIGYGPIESYEALLPDRIEEDRQFERSKLALAR